VAVLVGPDSPGERGRQAGRQFLRGTQIPLRGEDSMPEQFGYQVDQATATDARRPIADDPR
jgi:hypothetical protein